MKKVFSILFLILFSSCAPSLTDRLSLHEISPEQTDEQVRQFKTQSHPKVRVALVNDLRAHKIIAEMDGKDYGELGGATKVIQQGAERYFANNGYEITLLSAPTILIELSNWHTKVTPHILTTLVDSNAEIIVSLLDRNGRVVYRSIYDGNYAKTRMFINQSDVEKIHMQSMEYAILEASEDAKLREFAQKNQ